ncbi:MAG TPA: tetratricopeptide repeat-containing glycosyltransferase family protein [Alphaproteobacteria bacterium]|nr:tetratricopeptide repeat-containing glycosyltransferase family protein [Alphaproteobacteria bacterium]
MTTSHAPAEDETASASRTVAEGLRLFEAGAYDDAIDRFSQALFADPEDDDTRLKLGAALSAAGYGDAAVQVYAVILERDPTHRDALINRGNALLRLGRRAEALDALERATRAHPGSGAAWFNYGCALQAENRTQEAVAAYHHAIEDRDTLVRASANLGTSLGRLGRYREALAVYDRALDAAPEDANLRWNRACLLLLLGEDRLGWRDYEWRWRTAEHGGSLRHADRPLWQGEPLQGRRILLHAEQGMGDTIQFARYVTDVAARGGRAILEVQPALKRLLSRLAGAEAVYAVGDALPPCDVQCPLLSLPSRLGDVAHDVPYIAAPEPAAVCRDPRRPDRLHVGIAWAGSPTNSADRERSLDLRQFEPLSRIQAVTLVSLQTGPAAAERAWHPWACAIIDPMEGVTDFADTARIVAALDLVISVDTAVAHLAGAMGKPVWLINRFDTCWRWGPTGETTPWYPTMRVFRQPTPGDWPTPLARVAEELKRLSLACPVTTVT